MEGTGMLSFNIGVNDRIVYSGTAYPKPDTQRYKVNISNICQNYLKTEIDSFNIGKHYHDDAYLTFHVFNVNGELINDYNFLNCWDYVTHITSATGIVLSNPINGHYTDGQIKPITQFYNGRVYTDVLNSSGHYTVRKCGEYALVYLNRKGGFDSFLIEGRVKVSDRIESYQTTDNYNHGSLEFGNRIYDNEITPAYELTTGVLTDAQSRNLAENLISSPKVYLQKIGEWIRPVIIENQEAQYQTFRNNGRKFNTYTINVAESQIKTRQ